MTIIRGATTAERDSGEEIAGAVKELLDEIFARNALKREEVKGFLFSLTSDLHSRHPAKAARESGYDFAPLFACVEPDIDGGLPRCIRVMLFTERAGGAVHVYLRGAKVLRGAGKARWQSGLPTIITSSISIRVRCTAPARWRLFAAG